MNCVSKVLIFFTTPEYYHEINHSPVEHEFINNLLSYFFKMLMYLQTRLFFNTDASISSFVISHVISSARKRKGS
jgi:hypothetical protein